MRGRRFTSPLQLIMALENVPNSSKPCPPLEQGAPPWRKRTLQRRSVEGADLPQHVHSILKKARLTAANVRYRNLLTH